MKLNKFVPDRVNTKGNIHTFWYGMIALLLLIFSENAHVGQLHLQNIELSKVIQQSTHIIIAVPDTPPFVEEQVAIDVPGKIVPPYIRQVDRFRVQEVLYGIIETGATISIVPARDIMQEQMHRDYYVKGLSRHVIVNHYDRVSDYKADEPQILLLRNMGTRFAYTVDGGSEGLLQRGEIERILGEK